MGYGAIACDFDFRDRVPTMLVDCKRREDWDRTDAVVWKRKVDVEIPTIGDDLTSFGRRFVRVFRTPAVGCNVVVNRISKHLPLFAGVSGLDFDHNRLVRIGGLLSSGESVDVVFTLRRIDGDDALVGRIYNPVAATLFRLATPAILFQVFRSGCGATGKSFLHPKPEIGSARRGLLLR